MPLFYYYCTQCDIYSKRILEKPIKSNCIKCSFILIRTPKPPSSQKLETIDNGYMARRIERPVDIGELTKERATKHTRENPKNDDPTEKDPD